jgi:hypothetical protein
MGFFLVSVSMRAPKVAVVMLRISLWGSPCGRPYGSEWERDSPSGRPWGPPAGRPRRSPATVTNFCLSAAPAFESLDAKLRFALGLRGLVYLRLF